MNKKRLIIVVRGGVVEAVYLETEAELPEVVLCDLDNAAVDDEARAMCNDLKYETENNYRLNKIY
jgi:hypothetical protein